MVLRSEKLVLIIKGLISLIGFPNNKYLPNTKNYLPCLVIGGAAFSIRRKGLILGARDATSQEPIIVGGEDAKVGCKVFMDTGRIFASTCKS